MDENPIPDGGVEIPLHFTGLDEGRSSAEEIFKVLTSNADRLQQKFENFRSQLATIGRVAPWGVGSLANSPIPASSGGTPSGGSAAERLRSVGMAPVSGALPGIDGLRDMLSSALHPKIETGRLGSWNTLTNESKDLATVFRNLKEVGGSAGESIKALGKNAFTMFKASAFGRSLGFSPNGPGGQGQGEPMTPETFARALGRFMAARSVAGMGNVAFEYAKNPLHDNFRINAAQRSVNSTINTLATTGSPTAALISGLTSLAMSGIERRNQMMRTDYNFAQQSMDTRRSVAEQKGDWAFNAMFGMRSRGEQIRMLRARSGRIRGVQNDDTIADDIANANDRVQIAKQRLNEALGIRPVHEKNEALQSVRDSKRISEIEKKQQDGTTLSEDEKKVLERLKAVVAASQNGKGGNAQNPTASTAAQAQSTGSQTVKQQAPAQPAPAAPSAVSGAPASNQKPANQPAQSAGGNEPALPAIPTNLQGVQKERAAKAKAEYESAAKALKQANDAKAAYLANKPESGETTVSKLLGEIKENERIIESVMSGSYKGKDPGPTAEKLRERNRALQEMVGNLMQTNPDRYAFGLGKRDRLRAESMAWEKTDLGQVFSQAGKKGAYEKEISAVKKALGKGENESLSYTDLMDSANRTKLAKGPGAVEANTLRNAFYDVPNVAKQKLEQYDQDVIGNVQQGLFKNKDMASLKEALEIAKANGINIDDDANFRKIRETYLGQERRAETLEFQADKLKYDPSQILSAYTDASRTTDTMARQGFMIGSQVDVQDVNRDILQEVRKAIPLLQKMAQKEVSYSDVGLSPSSMFK